MTYLIDGAQFTNGSCVIATVTELLRITVKAGNLNNN